MSEVPERIVQVGHLRKWWGDLPDLSGMPGLGPSDAVCEGIATRTFDGFGTAFLTVSLYRLIGLPFVRLTGCLEQRFSNDCRTPGRKPFFSFALCA